MGFLGSVFSFILGEALSSSPKASEKYSKFSDKIEYEDAVYKKRILTDAKQKARSTGRTDVVGKIDSKMKDVDEAINSKRPKY
ncbi:MAG: hypothetical protein IKB72_02460 [Ruminococcus sp.]|nr:hypothetical protein [Ruminococcus sp.]